MFLFYSLFCHVALRGSSALRKWEKKLYISLSPPLCLLHLYTYNNREFWNFHPSPFSSLTFTDSSSSWINKGVWNSWNTQQKFTFPVPIFVNSKKGRKEERKEERKRARGEKEKQRLPGPPDKDYQVRLSSFLFFSFLSPPSHRSTVQIDIHNINLHIYTPT